MEKIQSAAQLRDFRRAHRIGMDWHEPDQADITARVEGSSFDNAGFWPRQDLVGTPTESIRELHVIFSRTREGQPPEDLAVVNLANLCAWADWSVRP